MTLTTPEIDALNQRCYDTCADQWIRFPFGDLLPEWVKKYHNRKLGARVLDIGSGNGILAEWLKKEGFDVLCLDPSAEMVRRCQTRGLPTLQTTIQDFQSKETFASIFAILSLIHVPKAELPAQIDKIASLLPSGGTLFLALIKGATEEIKEQETGYPRFFATYTQEEILSAFSSSFQLLDYRRALSTNTSTPCLLFTFKKS